MPVPSDIDDVLCDIRYLFLHEVDRDAEQKVKEKKRRMEVLRAALHHERSRQPSITEFSSSPNTPTTFLSLLAHYNELYDMSLDQESDGEESLGDDEWKHPFAGDDSEEDDPEFNEDDDEWEDIEGPLNNQLVAAQEKVDRATEYEVIFDD